MTQSNTLQSLDFETIWRALEPSRMKLDDQDRFIGSCRDGNARCTHRVLDDPATPGPTGDGSHPHTTTLNQLIMEAQGQATLFVRQQSPRPDRDRCDFGAHITDDGRLQPVLETP